MKNFYPLLFLISFTVSVTLQAQKLSKGYIVDLKKDTVKGYIIDRTDSELSSTIQFKKGKKDRDLFRYSTSDLLGFGFNYGRTFERIAFTDSLHDTVMVFAKLILEGKLKLYIWRRNNWTDFDVFLFNTDPPRFAHLTEPTRKIMQDEKGNQYTIEKINHIGLLKIMKGDSSKIVTKEKNIRYAEDKIVRNILQYNQAYQEKYPIKRYLEKVANSFDFTIGLPVFHAPEGSSFRFAFYWNVFHPEKNRSFTFMNGISYRYWKSSEDHANQAGTFDWNFMQQWISLLPVGFNYHKATGVIRPYLYGAFGISVWLTKSYHSVDYDNLSHTLNHYFLPAVNVGIGLKIKVGDNFIALELTPTGNGSGIFANMGFSF